jgi:hypothetical protein
MCALPGEEETNHRILEADVGVSSMVKEHYFAWLFPAKYLR